MIKQECIGIPDMILLYEKNEAEIIMGPGGAYFPQKCPMSAKRNTKR